MRVLIVDDQPIFRRQLCRLLAYAGFEVVGEAGDISSAEAAVVAREPDLAIIDINLPGENGLDGTARLKTRFPSLRVILVSAYRDQSSLYAASAKAVGAEAFFAKDDLDITVVWAWDANRD